MEYPAAVYRFLDRVEQQFDERRALPWMNNYWWMSFVFSGIYLTLIYLGHQFMKNRKPYDLRRALCMWSTGLAAFSIYACCRAFPHLWNNIIMYGGFEYSICDVNYFIGSTHLGIWSFLFPLSKLPELFDTVFIILRKSKLSFLHYYHHFSVFIYCWYSYAFPISTGVWFGSVNYFVHAIMYTYYAIKASGRNPPRWTARVITTLQLSQMFFGMFFNYTAIRAVTLGKVCAMDWFTVGISVFFYVSYAILFGNFYYWTYVYNRPRKSDTINVISREIPKGSSSEKECSSLMNGHINGLALTTPTYRS